LGGFIGAIAGYTVANSIIDQVIYTYESLFGTKEPVKACYKMLGISLASTDEAVNQAYRYKAKLHHPDKGGDEESFRKLGACVALIRIERSNARK
jgi:hypothetical protein